MKRFIGIGIAIIVLAGCSPNNWTYAYPYDPDCVIIKGTDHDTPTIKPGIYCKVEIQHP